MKLVSQDVPVFHLLFLLWWNCALQIFDKMLKPHSTTSPLDTNEIRTTLVSVARPNSFGALFSSLQVWGSLIENHVFEILNFRVFWRFEWHKTYGFSCHSHTPRVPIQQKPNDAGVSLSMSQISHPIQCGTFCITAQTVVQFVQNYSSALPPASK